MKSVVLALCLASPLAAAQRGTVTDADIVANATLVAAGERVELYHHGIAVDRAFLQKAEEACRRLERLLGRPLEIGPKISIYVADLHGPSHVWRGYGHPQDPRPIVFLNRRAYEGAMLGTNATYAHEIAHLFTWRFASHTLREGFADYLALELHPGAAVGPNLRPEANEPIPADIAELLGTTRQPPGGVVESQHYRRLYYQASYRFVRFLVRRSGMETFLKLYDSSDPEAAFAALYGANRAQLVRQAGI